MEVHTETELSAALDLSPILGINNRDLKTVCNGYSRDAPLAQGDSDTLRAKRCLVGKSGIGSRDDVLFLADAGVDALLIGEVFMRADSIEKKMRELFGPV